MLYFPVSIFDSEAYRNLVLATLRPADLAQRDEK